MLTSRRCWIASQCVGWIGRFQVCRNGSNGWHVRPLGLGRGIARYDSACNDGVPIEVFNRHARRNCYRFFNSEFWGDIRLIDAAVVAAPPISAAGSQSFPVEPRTFVIVVVWIGVVGSIIIVVVGIGVPAIVGAAASMRTMPSPAMFAPAVVASAPVVLAAPSVSSATTEVLATAAATVTSATAVMATSAKATTMMTAAAAGINLGRTGSNANESSYAKCKNALYLHGSYSAIESGHCLGRFNIRSPGWQERNYVGFLPQYGWLIGLRIAADQTGRHVAIRGVDTAKRGRRDADLLQAAGPESFFNETTPMGVGAWCRRQRQQHNGAVDVLGSTTSLPSETRCRSFLAAATDASLGTGAGAKVFVGGDKTSIVRQRSSVEGQTRGVAIGVSGLKLEER